MEKIGDKSLSERISCTKKNKDRLMNGCVRIFLSHHPEFEGMNLTQNFILEKVIEYYEDGE